MTITVINPATKAVYQSIQETTETELNGVVENAKQAFEVWRSKSDEERTQAMLSIADDIEANAAELAEIIVSEQGKPLGLAQMEVGGAAGWTRYNSSLALETEVIEDSAERYVEMQRLPVGVVASITPWNWPLMIAVWHIMPALKAGCSVVVKPASTTPVNTIKLAEIINKHTVPNLVQVVVGGGPRLVSL